MSRPMTAIEKVHHDTLELLATAIAKVIHAMSAQSVITFRDRETFSHLDKNKAIEILIQIREVEINAIDEKEN